MFFKVVLFIFELLWKVYSHNKVFELLWKHISSIFLPNVGLNEQDFADVSSPSFIE